MEVKKGICHNCGDPDEAVELNEDQLDDLRLLGEAYCDICGETLEIV